MSRKKTLFTLNNLKDYYNKTMVELLFDTNYDVNYMPVPLQNEMVREIIADYIEENSDYYDLLEKYKDTQKDQFAHMRKSLKFLFYRNKFNIEHYYNLLSLEYDPIANYDKNSTITTNYGAQKTTTNYGAVKDTVTIGSQSNSNLNKNANIDDNTLFEHDKSETSIGSRTDNTTTDARTDNASADAHIDTVTEHTRGNVGTTRTGQMIGDELNDVIPNIKFYDYMKNLIIGYVCNATMIIPSICDNDDEYYVVPTTEGLNIRIATSSHVGLVKPDNVTITINENGEISSTITELDATDVTYKTTNVEDALDGIGEDIANIETRIDELDASDIEYSSDYFEGIPHNVGAYLDKHNEVIDSNFSEIAQLHLYHNEDSRNIRDLTSRVDNIESDVTTINNDIVDINNELDNRTKARYVERDSTLFNSIVNANSWGVVHNLIENVGDTLLLSLRGTDATIMRNNGLIPSDNGVGGVMYITKILSGFLLIQGYGGASSAITHYFTNSFVAMTNTPNWFKITGTKI